MLRGTNSIRVAVLAALLLAVAFSSTIAGRLPGGRAVAAARQSKQRAVEQQQSNSAWQAQLSDERSRLQQAQAQQAASAQSTVTPPAATPAPTAAPAGASVQDIITAAFSPLGATAVQWGLCIAQHESTDNPSAIQPGPDGAEGLFQFEPETWTTTPEGQAGDSIFDATASSQAAAWEYAQGNYSAWTTNADYCSMYD